MRIFFGKSTILTLLILFLFNCQGKKSEKQPAVQQKAQREESAPKKAVVTMKIGDKDTTITDLDVRNDLMNDQIAIQGGATVKNGGLLTFDLEFTGKQPGALKEVYLTIKGYQIDKVSGTLEHFDKNSLKGTFRGMLRKLNKNGFPIKGDIPFSGTFEK